MRPVGLFIYMEKPDYSIRIVRLPIDATSKDAMKLRKTGFEFSQSFVIRLAGNPEGLAASSRRRMGPAIGKRGCLGISLKFDEFPNQLWCGKYRHQCMQSSLLRLLDEVLQPRAFVFITQN